MRRLAPVLTVLAALAAAPGAHAGTIYTLAGRPEPGVARDGEPATSASLSPFASVAALPDGDILVGDDERVWRLDGTGRLHVIAGMADARPGLEADFLAALPGGGFLVGGLDHIRRVAPDGTLATLAGDGPDGVDGVPARESQIDGLTGVAAAPGGGFVYAEDEGRVRRVGPDGIVRTIAGRIQPDGAGRAIHGQSATSVALDPDDVAVAADGSVLIAEGYAHRVDRVTADGTIHVAARGRAFYPTAIAATPDGGFLAVDEGLYPTARVWRFAPDGTRTALAGTGPLQLTAPDGLVQDLTGGDARAAILNGPQDIAATPDGGAVISDFASAIDDREEGSLVRYLAPPSPSVLAVALLRDARRVFVPGRPGAIGVALTRPATVTLSVAGHATTAALPGRASTLPLPALPAGGAPLVRVAATDAAGRQAFDRTRVYPAGWLPTETARLLVTTLRPHAEHHACRRAGPARVDCHMRVHIHRCRTLSVTLAHRRLQWGEYGCAFARRPRYRIAPHPLRGSEWQCPSDPRCPPRLFGRVSEAALLPSD